MGTEKRRRVHLVDRWNPGTRLWEQLGEPFRDLYDAEQYTRRYRAGGASGVRVLLRIRPELVEDNYIPPGYGEAA